MPPTAPKRTKLPPKKALEIHIQTTPEALWDALTNPDRTEAYYFGARLEGTLAPGAPYRYTYPDGSVLHDGEVIEVVPHERLVMTFRPLFNLEEGGDPANLNVSRMVYEITQEGPSCRLVLTYEDMDETDTVEGYVSGSSRIFSGLKTLLETGAPMAWQRPDAG